MMTRTVVAIDPALQRSARRKASELGISFSEYVRRLVARDVGRRGRPANPSAVFGLGDSGGSDIARDEDRMIGEAASAARLRRRPNR